jgi:xanthine dehydrogenase YagR molybdenum-binding subunit
MNVIPRLVRLIAKMLPDRQPDPLIHATAVIGTPMSRLDGEVKVTGSAPFTADVALPSMAYAALMCSDIPAGRITAIDTAQAEQAPGVLLVMTYQNAPVMDQAPGLISNRGAMLTSAPIMRDPLIRWNGEPAAVVVAETREQAEHAAALVTVAYQPAPARLSFGDLRSQARRAPDVHEPAELTRGDAGAAIANGDVVIDEVYRTPRENHAAIEPHAATAEWHGEDRLTLHDESQAISLTQATLATVFGLDPANVRVLSRYVGGGFGNKLVWSHQILCAAAARLCGRPVQLVLSREDVFRTTGGRSLTEQRVTLAARRDGTLDALVHTGITTTGINDGWVEQFTSPARQLYRAGTYRVEQKVVELNTVATTYMRAPGEAAGSFSLESAMDELAAAVDIDPIELRRRAEPARAWAYGTAFSSRNLVEAFRIGAERFRWNQRHPVPRSRRDGEWWVGQGVAAATYPYDRFPGAQVAIRLTADGRAIVRTAAQEMGMGTATVQVQHAAERLGLPVERVAFEYGDSDLPNAVYAGGSAQTASIIAAAEQAARALVKKLLGLAGAGSPLAGLHPRDVEARDGGLYRKDGDAGESYVSILRRADRDMVEAEASGPRSLELLKHSMHSYGAQFCEVQVSDVTGEVRVSRWVGAFDTGRILNPKTAASQFRGGIIMGIGMALTEETLFDERTGRIINPSLAEYHIPVHADVPPIDVLWTGIPDSFAPAGAKGIGQIGVTGVAAAIANAVYNATGQRVRDLPITPDKILTTPPQTGTP